ncbi:hypothetical protein CYMTET_49005 [Cymbomonas tetramitiformis]|uniref:imidazoleglycerol-phosphate dehydratase n=1 Tax=Cymbomonas tetramitiformis TaxID=36881 RepID=A0AAE0EUB4_9CHLO|nr:hypothetical protein CYMTET_49005 [Cymbomonas tetramitiformis]
MLDQLGTHGLLDVSVEVRGRTQDVTDEQVNGAVGTAVGQAFADLGLCEHHVSSTFSAPLDESLVGATLSLDGPSQLTYDVGFPTKLVGTYETRLPELFFQNFIQACGMSLSLIRQTPKNRGNSHHIIEATFKAVARALRAAIDEVDQRPVEGTLVKREASIHRKTGETDVDVDIKLDGKGTSDCDTMIPHLDLMLKDLAETSGISFKVECEGDIHIDDHHTNEDIAIVIGKALQEALGNRSGINRMGFASATVGEAQVEVTLDLSGRPHLEYELEIPDERVGTYDTQLVEHFYQSIVNNSGTTLHVRGISGTNSPDLIAAGIHAFGAALKMAVRFDDRRLGKIASSKGVL